MSIVLILILIVSGWLSPVSTGEWSAYEAPAQMPVNEWGANARIVRTLPDSGTLAIVNEDGVHTGDGAGWSLQAATVPGGSVAMSADEPSVLLAGDKAECMRGGPGTPLQRSVDGGVTWTAVEGEPEIEPLAIWSADGLAIGASCTGLEISEDGGLTWSVLPGIDPGWDVTAFAVVPQTDRSGPVVLVGLTGEGGTSYLHSVDLSDPAAPVVSDELRMYYAIGGLAGVDDTFVLAAMDGAWISTDAGETWERSAEGLEGIVLEQDPAEVGLPADIDPREVGLYSVAMLTDGSLIVGSAEGLYAGSVDGEPWTKVEGTSGLVGQLVVSSDGTVAVYRADDVVVEVVLTAP